MGMYVKLEYILSIGHWLIDNVLPDDNLVTRENIRKAFYAAYANRMMMQAVNEDQIQEAREKDNEQIPDNSTPCG